MQTILITGTSSGIGNSIATYLSSKGYTIIGTSRNPKQGNKNFKELKLDMFPDNFLKRS